MRASSGVSTPIMVSTSSPRAGPARTCRIDPQFATHAWRWRCSTEDGTRRSFETPVARPQRQSGPMRRCQQMHVHPAEALFSEAMSPEEIERFPKLDDRRARQRGEQVQYFVPAHQRATSQLTDDEGVRPHLVGLEVAGQAVASMPEVIDPDRSVDEHAESADARAPARHGPQAALRSAECRKASGAFAADECAQTRVNHRRLLF